MKRNSVPRQTGCYKGRELWYNDCEMNINVTSPKVLKSLMEQYGIAPLKKLGQNFLVDGNIADKIAEAAVPKGACVLEIGPGFGALTVRLIERADIVAAYEIDAGLSRALAALFEGETRFRLFHKDFLKADINSELKDIFAERDIYVAANLPYYITSACIMTLLSAKLNIKMITVMVQKEVADRICAAPGGKDYGALSALIGYFAKPRRLFNVSPACFFPRPEVDSAVAQLEVIPRADADVQEYVQTVKGLFAMRRKTVKSNLRQAFALSAKQAQDVLKNAGIDENARAEMLSVNDFLIIGREIRKNY
jgi:16S rRNA (adenine1518-N6/adenine1519-N6)-dimethyltransferase